MGDQPLWQLYFDGFRCLAPRFSLTPLTQFHPASLRSVHHHPSSNIIVQSCPTWRVGHIVDKFTNHFGVSWWDIDPYLSLIFTTSSYSTIQAGHIMVRCPIFTYALISLIHSYHILILHHPCWSHRGKVSHLDICTNLTHSLLSRPHPQSSLLVISWSGVPFWHMH